MRWARRSSDSSKIEIIRKRGPWRKLHAVECATLQWIGRFNTRRLLAPVGGCASSGVLTGALSAVRKVTDVVQHPCLSINYENNN